MFQSHAGSIEAKGSRVGDVQDAAFQSHAGSIEAWPEALDALDRLYRFNPTLVRLRRGIPTAFITTAFAVSIPRWFD